MEIYRLDRWLTVEGLASRKEAGKLIKKGLVSVNGTVITDAKTKVKEGSLLCLDGKEIQLSSHVYYMLNKPQGVLSASRDKKQPTVLDLLPKDFKRPDLFPAGRLDKDTEGFVLITDDGKFAHEILSPKNRVPKTYRARLDKNFDIDKIRQEFANGVAIGDGEVTSPANIDIIEDTTKPLVQLTIYEGMFHQVKRMFEKSGLEVIYLKRTKIGGLMLDENLKLGESRKITEQEKNSIL